MTNSVVRSQGPDGEGGTAGITVSTTSHLTPGTSQQLRQSANVESSRTPAPNATDRRYQPRATKATTEPAALIRSGLAKESANSATDAGKSTRNKHASAGSTARNMDDNGTGDERDITIANNANPILQQGDGKDIPAIQPRATKFINTTNKGTNDKFDKSPSTRMRDDKESRERPVIRQTTAPDSINNTTGRPARNSVKPITGDIK